MKDGEDTQLRIGFKSPWRCFTTESEISAQLEGPLGKAAGSPSQVLLLG